MPNVVTFRGAIKLSLVLFVLSIPVVAAIVAAVLGAMGPTLLYSNSDGVYEAEMVSGTDWHGVGHLSAETWQATMRHVGGIVKTGTSLDSLWGGMTAEHGDIMLGAGPRGIAIAGCFAPGSMYGGYMRTWLVLPHVLLIPASLTLFVLLFVRLRYPFYCPHLWQIRKRPLIGHCIKCGYNLRGLSECRCPECGYPFYRGADDGLQTGCAETIQTWRIPAGMGSVACLLLSAALRYVYQLVNGDQFTIWRDIDSSFYLFWVTVLPVLILVTATTKGVVGAALSIQRIGESKRVAVMVLMLTSLCAFFLLWSLILCTRAIAFFAWG